MNFETIQFWGTEEIGKYFLYVTVSDILSLVELRRHQLETWSESDLIMVNVT